MREENEGKAGEAVEWKEVYLPTINDSSYPLTVESFETEEGAIAWAQRWLDEQAERVGAGCAFEEAGVASGSGAVLALIRAARPSAAKYRRAPTGR